MKLTTAIDAVLGDIDFELLTQEEAAEYVAIMEQALGDVWSLTPKQLYAEEVWRKVDWLLYGGAAGGAKQLALSSRLPTPSGWTTMGEVGVGDELFTERGEVCRVLQLHPVDHNAVAYRLTFDDGSTVEADADHRWWTYDAAELIAATRRNDEWRAARRAKRPSRVTGKPIPPECAGPSGKTLPAPVGGIRTTAEIAATLTTASGRRNHAIPVCDQIDLPEVKLPIDPYVLGAWLGDGTSANSGFTGIDPEIWGEIKAAGYEMNHYDSRSHWIVGLNPALRRLGLLRSKHIPAIYLRASAKQRLALLQGLMDTDGTVRQTGACSFVNTNERIARGVHELACSLGIKASIAERRTKLNGEDKGPCWMVRFTSADPVFRLPRKLERQQNSKIRRTTQLRYIVSCDRIDPMPMRCITVSNPTGIFLCGDSFIPTHNSELAIHHVNRLSQEIPGHSSLLMRRSIPELRRSLIIRLIGRIARFGLPAKYGKVDGQPRFLYTNGSIVECGHCQTEEAVGRYLCFHPDHEILTEEGWKPVADVQMWETVATVDPKTRKMWYEPVTAVHAYDYDGDMIEVDQSHGVSFSVTPNHTMWYTTDKRSDMRPARADELPRGAMIPQTTEWGSQRMPHPITFKSDGNNGRSITIEPKLFAEFLGWWCSEGSADAGRWAVRIHQQKAEGCAQIENMLDRMGVNWWYSAGAYSFSSKALVQWLHEKSGTHARTKRLPQWVVQHWPAELLNILLTAYTAGDGTSYNNDQRRIIVTGSRGMQEDLGIVAIKAGWRVVWAEQAGQAVNGYEPNGPMYRVYLCRPKKLDCAVRPAQIQRVPYKGPVHCVTVPPHNTLITRRNNRVCIVGNSAEYDCVVIDEATTVTENQITQVASRLRTTREKALLGARPHLGLFTNPGGISHAWMYDLFITPTHYGQQIIVYDVSQGLERKHIVASYEAPINVATATAGEIMDVLLPWIRGLEIEADPATHLVCGFVPSKATDNPYLDPSYLKNLNTLDERRRRQLRDGDWDTFAGQYFETWNRAIHVIEPFEIPDGWYRARGIDWGSTSPFACVYGAWDPDGNCYIYREEYGAGLSPTEQAKKVLAPTVPGKREKFGATVADPSVFSDRRGTGKSIADMWRDAGMNTTRAKNQRPAGWANMKQYMWDPMKVAPNGEYGWPRLFVFSNCTNLARTIPLMQVDSHNDEDLDTTLEDHAVDACRYLLAVRPMSAQQRKEAPPMGADARFAQMVRRLDKRKRKW